MIVCELHQPKSVVAGHEAEDWCEVCRMKRILRDLRSAANVEDDAMILHAINERIEALWKAVRSEAEEK